MKSLENKIPPPIVMAIFALLIWLLRGFGPIIPFYGTLKLLLVGALVLTAITIDISALLEFRKFKTTINPLSPQNTSNIVTSGIYSKTRNPMYLGMLIILIAWAIFVGSIIGLFIVPLFWAYITRFQIIPEERVLIEKFGQEYLDYLKRVKPWL